MVDFAKLLAESKAKKNETEVAVKQATEAKPQSATDKLKASLEGKSNTLSNGGKKIKFGFKNKNSSSKSNSKSKEVVPHSSTVGPDKTEGQKQVATAPVQVHKSQDFVHPEQSDKYTPEEVELIQNNIAILHANMEDKEIVAQVMRQILTSIRQNENLNELMKPEDCGAMVEHLRHEYGVEIVKKAGRAKTKTAKTQEVDAVAEELGDLF